MPGRRWVPGHVLDACFVEDLQTAGLFATSCMNLEQPMVGGFAASADTELASRRAELVRYGVRIRRPRSHCKDKVGDPLGSFRACPLAAAYMPSTSYMPST